MFGREKPAALAASGKIENVLGPNSTFNGRLKAKGNVRVDGFFEGAIETDGNVIIGETAKVLADISAHAVQVWGAVKGNIDAVGRLEIMSTGRVWGDIKVTSLLIDEGGLFRGKSVMEGEDAEPFIPEGSADKEPEGEKDAS